MGFRTFLSLAVTIYIYILYLYIYTYEKNIQINQTNINNSERRKERRPSEYSPKKKVNVLVTSAFVGKTACLRVQSKGLSNIYIYI